LREKKEDLEEYRRKLEEELADVSTRISRLS
jgi:prefoldin subunit 5